MAHQFVHEVLQQHGETAHGPAFRETCKKLGIDASAGRRAVTENGQSSEEAKPTRRYSSGSLASSRPRRERQRQRGAGGPMSAAQRLMLKYNLDSVRDHVSRGYGFRHLGQASGRVTEAERVLAKILSEHFFVEVIWVPVYRPLEQKNGSILEVCGTPANLEMASYVHAFLTHTAEQLWRAQGEKQNGIRRNRDRRTYLAGRDGLSREAEVAAHRAQRARHGVGGRRRLGGSSIAAGTRSFSTLATPETHAPKRTHKGAKRAAGSCCTGRSKADPAAACASCEARPRGGFSDCFRGLSDASALRRSFDRRKIVGGRVGPSIELARRRFVAGRNNQGNARDDERARER